MNRDLPQGGSGPQMPTGPLCSPEKRYRVVKRAPQREGLRFCLLRAPQPSGHLLCKIRWRRWLCRPARGVGARKGVGVEHTLESEKLKASLCLLLLDFGPAESWGLGDEPGGGENRKQSKVRDKAGKRWLR